MIKECNQLIRWKYRIWNKKVLVSEKEEIKCKNMMKLYKNDLMMVQRENIKEHNSNWPEIPCHTYRMLIIGGSGSGKTNSLFDLICHQPNIHKNYLNAKDPFEANCQLLINKR